MSNHENRVFSRTGARELSIEEAAKVAGADSTCTFKTTFIHGAAVDTLVDNCLQ
ncbi:MAG TPA: hypothetical protein VHA33_21600 [Candidatus Angelobacter sp.]|jgi:hypothetical protein|nr:hypothetical protein [Candidatus Angelobacter sp.]